MIAGARSIAASLVLGVLVTPVHARTPPARLEVEVRGRTPDARRLDLGAVAGPAAASLILENSSGTRSARGAIELRGASWVILAGGVHVSTLGGWRSTSLRGIEPARWSAAGALSASTSRTRPKAVGASFHTSRVRIACAAMERGAVFVHAASRGLGLAWEAAVGTRRQAPPLAIASAGWLGARSGLVCSHRASDEGQTTRVLSAQTVSGVTLRLDWSSRSAPEEEPFFGAFRAGWRASVASRRFEVAHGVQEGSSGTSRKSTVALSGESPSFRWWADITRRDAPFADALHLRLAPRALGARSGDSAFARLRWAVEVRAEAGAEEPVAFLAGARLEGTAGALGFVVQAKSALVRAFPTVIGMGRETRPVWLPEGRELVSLTVRLRVWEAQLVRQPTTEGEMLSARVSLRWEARRARTRPRSTNLSSSLEPMEYE